MPIGISDEHGELAATVEKWATSGGATASVRAAESGPAGLQEWTEKCAEMGLTAIAIPGPAGGDGDLLDQAVALEAAAAALVPGELLTTVAAGILVEDESLRTGIAAGELSVGVGLRTCLYLEGDLLRGTVDVVAGAPLATHLLLGAGRTPDSMGPDSRLNEEGARWFVLRREQVEVEALPTPDFSRTVGRVRVDVLVADVLEVGLETGAVRELLVTLAAAEASGVARRSLDTAVDYAKTREQFGQKIGAFQAIKHLCAQMLETSESVTAAAWDAAVASADREDQRSFAVHVAATIAFDGAVEVAKDCIQVLGGIGFTFEHDAHLYLRRAIALRSLFGSSTTQAGELADAARAGVRRTSTIEFDGADAQIREQARETTQRIAALPASEQRAALAESGYLAPHWPVPYGLGAEPLEQLVIDEELTRAGLPRPDLKIGAWAAPTVLAHGNDEQRERFVRQTLTGEVVWCQLFSEPGAGSDLASLRTRAIRTEGGWLLTGQKVWTSLAQVADWGICLARTGTEGKPHAGITYFLLDMRSEGLDVRPLRELTGEEMFNEVFLDDVFVPDECVVGEVNGGWKLARTTLANERVAMAGARLDESVERAVLLYEDPVSRAEVGRAVALATVVKLLGRRATLRSLAGLGPGPESSVAKLVGVRSRQDSAELVVTLLGDRLFTDPELGETALGQQLLTRCLSIAGGTTQVLRNVAAERILGLPRG